MAQIVTPIHPFTALNGSFINSDGAFPSGRLVAVGDSLYGTASQGGTAAGGTIFKIKPDGTGFTPVYAFTPPKGANPGNGAFPLAGLIAESNVLYGTTSAGGAGKNGTVFKVNNDGGGFVPLHAFSAAAPGTGANTDGTGPSAALILSGNTLYGTATHGGDAGSGTVFKISTDGSNFTTLHSFSAVDTGTGTNTDGAFPLGGLVLLGNAVYGTTYRGGASGGGTVFKVGLDGSGFVNLHDIEGGSRAALLAFNNALYGTMESGGSLGGGAVFRLNTDGSGYTNLQEFATGASSGPWAELITDGNNLYGTTYGAGDSGQGSIFALDPNGASFTNLYSFQAGTDGAHPQSALVLSGTALYGCASEGGAAGNGTVFALSLSSSAGKQPLTVERSGNNVILRWPSDVAGLTLQETISFSPPVTWTATTPPPVVINGFYTVTTSISGIQKFYRLAR